MSNEMTAREVMERNDIEAQRLGRSYSALSQALLIPLIMASMNKIRSGTVQLPHDVQIIDEAHYVSRQVRRAAERKEKKRHGQ